MTSVKGSSDWLKDRVAILQLDFHDVTTGTPARVPQSFSVLFSIVNVLVSLLISCACARRLRALLEIQLDDNSTTDSTAASLTVRCPQRYLFLYFMETRGESETYKKTEQTRTIQQIHKDLT
ncbi:hypothetical protein TNCV_4855611 [Trichonephila clavipes]|nr:hypothetical protein TNCV_4855611 [Trichonephila clavipes]